MQTIIIGEYKIVFQYGNIKGIGKRVLRIREVPDEIEADETTIITHEEIKDWEILLDLVFTTDKGIETVITALKYLRYGSKHKFSQWKVVTEKKDA